MDHPIRLQWLFPGLLIALAGCASTPIRSSHSTASVAAVRSAEEVGADRNPRAALHVRLAREELGLARRLSQNGDEERSSLMFRRALMDAELALAITRETRATSEAREVVGRASAMRSATR